MKVAVVQGGPSTEAEVSRKSAKAVAAALSSVGHDTQLLELDPDLPAALVAARADVVFPAVHGAQGEDGCLQGLLEVLRVPYVGSDVRASALAADKLASKLFFRREGLKVPGEWILGARDEILDAADLIRDLREQVGPDLIVKPAQGGSTIGIERVLRDASAEDFERAFRAALQHDRLVLVEQYVRGEELTCAVLEDEDGPRALPVVLITSEATDWYDFESKYAPGGSRHRCPAPIDADAAEAVGRAAVLAHKALGARDLSRSDFILDAEGIPHLLELNTLPGMTEVSLFPDAARAAGISFEDLVDTLVQSAARRGVRRTARGLPLPAR